MVNLAISQVICHFQVFSLLKTMLQLTFFDIGLSWGISLNKMLGDGIDGLKMWREMN